MSQTGHTEFQTGQNYGFSREHKSVSPVRRGRSEHGAALIVSVYTNLSITTLRKAHMKVGMPDAAVFCSGIPAVCRAGLLAELCQTFTAVK